MEAYRKLKIRKIRAGLHQERLVRNLQQTQIHTQITNPRSLHPPHRLAHRHQFILVHVCLTASLWRVLSSLSLQNEPQQVSCARKFSPKPGSHSSR
jgi:hypothetical protein